MLGRVVLVLGIAAVSLTGPAVVEPGLGGGGAVAVVVSSANATRNLTLVELRRIFRAEQTFWPDGTAIVPLLPASGTDEKAALLATIYECDEAALRRFWISKVYEGAVAEPPRVTDGAETLGLVGQIAGAVALVALERVPPNGVGVVSIDGRRPGDRGYPLNGDGS